MVFFEHEHFIHGGFEAPDDKCSGGSITSSPEQAEARARKRVIDLAEAREHLLHSIAPVTIPLILKEGVVSQRYAATKLATSLVETYQPEMQQTLEVEGREGLNLISVDDPQRFRKIPDASVLDLLIGEKRDGRRISQWISDLVLLISPKARQNLRRYPFPYAGEGEAFIPDCIPTEQIDGLVASDRVLATPATEVAHDILYNVERYFPEDVFGIRKKDILYILRQRFLLYPFGDETLDALRIAFNQSADALRQTYYTFAQLTNFDPRRYRLYDFCVHIPDGLKPLPYGPLPISMEASRRNIIPYLPVDTLKGLTEVAQYIEALKRQVRDKRETGGQIRYADFVCMWGKLYTGSTEINIDNVAKVLGIEKLPTPKPKERKILWGLLSVTEPVENPRYDKSLMVDKTLALMDRIFEARKVRTQLDAKIWPRYAEKVAGKKLEEATFADFLTGSMSAICYSAL